ncbi:MAG: ribonuclease P protein component [Nitrospirota bacterium]
MVPPRSTRAQHLLRNSAAIRLVFKEGKRVSCPLFTLLYRRNDLDRTRVGVVVGKKLGGAVARNRSKRRFRELGRLSLRGVPCGLDLLILPKRESVVEPAGSLREIWQAVLKRAQLVASENSR